MCGVQGHADSGGPPRPVADVRGVGVRPRGERELLLAARVHASLLRVTRLCSSLRLGVQTRPLPRGTEIKSEEIDTNHSKTCNCVTCLSVCLKRIYLCP